ncbi:MAG: lycopene cyclase family protein [Leptolyngbyaceae bacterium]|nr:lycopene cyclase family protein [Leptolyngbyaceae bacterium]
MLDVLVVGTGPAGLAIAAQLCQNGLQVGGLAPTPPTQAWSNTYGIWRDELDALNLSHLLAHQWHQCVGYFGSTEKNLNRTYGLLDKQKLQTHLLDQCQQGQMTWHLGTAGQIDHYATHSTVVTPAGTSLNARLVIDATGHKPVFVRRSPPQSTQGGVAYQAAYGIVGRFSTPPINPDRFVLMDYRADHLSPPERLATPTFLYGMNLGDDVFFVEETSLAACPAVPFDILKQRLQKRLALQGVQLLERHDEEYCLFPMNAPMPPFDQAVVGFGGSASMVHPASGYMVGALLRRAPILAEAIATTLDQPHASPSQLSAAAWSALWPSDRLRKYYIYLFGLENLMRFDQPQLCRFFNSFFDLPQSHWSGFLADTLPMSDLLVAMLNLFGRTPNSVRLGLMQSFFYDSHWLWRSLLGS